MKFLPLLLAAAACAIPKAPLPAPDVTVPLAAQATFRVNLQEYDLETDEWVDAGSGTAWIVHNDVVSFLVTAGHVCEDGAHFTLDGRDGKEYGALVVRKSTAFDLCLIRSEFVIGPELPLAAAMPEYDEPVAAVGAPLGVFACWGGSSVDQCGMAPISRGFYAGGALVSMPMAGGNSGSAVFTRAGVIGVLIEGYRGFDSLSFIAPLSQLRAFLEG